MAKDQKVMFHSTVFGPIRSRRLGISLGINLGPDDGKVCSFDCIYCEAGYNEQGVGTTGLPSREHLFEQLHNTLSRMKQEEMNLDVITFSGNGEPTLHPDFKNIVDDVLKLRNEFFPNAKVSVLTNSTRIFTPEICQALESVDNNILKLDSAVQKTMELIDQPVSKSFTVEKVVEALKRFAGTGIIQTMMLRGVHDGQIVDNTTDVEINALIEAYKIIKPKEVMLYSIDRSTPEENLVKVERDELDKIATIIRNAGINVVVS